MSYIHMLVVISSRDFVMLGREAVPSPLALPRMDPASSSSVAGNSPWHYLSHAQNGLQALLTQRRLADRSCAVADLPAVQPG